MKCCPICNRDITEEKKFLFLGKNGDCWLICKTCEQKLYHVTNGKRKRWVHLTIADLNGKMKHCKDQQLKSFVQELIEHRVRDVGMHIPHL